MQNFCATAGKSVRCAYVRDEAVVIFGETTHKVRGGDCIRVVLHTPTDEFNHYRQKIESFLSRLIDYTSGLARIAPPGDQPRGFELLQSACENIRRDPLVACQQLLEVTSAYHDDVAEHH